jgi:regulation of enolase protein 1 (concanavalin A-like superfamily)
MGKRIIVWVALVLGLVTGTPNAIYRVWEPTPILAAEPDASLMGYWKFDGDTLDSSGNDRHGTLVGNALLIPMGAHGGGLSLDGNGDYVTIPGYKGVNAVDGVQHAFTVANWFRTTFDTGDREMVTWGTNAAGQRLSWRVFEGTLRTEHGNGNLRGTTVCNDGEWHHAALVVTDGANLRVPATRLYLDGVEEAITSGSNNAFYLTEGADVSIGRRADNNTRYWLGDLDEVRIYDRALTADEIKALAIHERAFNPSPADGAQDAGTPLLTWQPREVTMWHDVYLGTDPNLTSANRVASHLMATMYWHVPGLTPGTTYYWRVDETDADGTVFTGDVWSFFYAPKDAYNPTPADGEPFVDADLTLSWLAGLNSISHDVYLGTDRTAVAEGTGGTFKGNQASATFPAGVLPSDTRFYWRIDETAPDGTKIKGNVWTFKTLPVIAPAADPNLAGWWTFDEGAGTRAVDWSGHGRHGQFNPAGSPTWVAGYDGAALSFDGAGSGDYVTVDSYNGILGSNPFSIALWVKSTSADDETMVNWGASSAGQRIDFRLYQGRLRVEHGNGNLQGDTPLNDGEWHHVACVVSQNASLQAPDIAIYLDGYDDTQTTTDPDKFDIVGTFPVTIGQRRTHGDREFLGEIDDVRIFETILTRAQIKTVMMRFDPLRAWQPYPAGGSIVDIRTAAPLTWTKGDNASNHDVYFGTDAAAVAAADTTDASGIYRGRVSQSSFTPAEDLEGPQEYFWRVDEINADGSITAGQVWTFTLADYLIVDDFESYDDQEGNEIFSVWIDGFTDGLSNSLVGLYPEAVKGTFCETIVVHSGRRSMPMDYNNTMTPFYSEAVQTFVPAQNWTVGGGDTLVVYFRGEPTGFTESAGTITLSAAGTDIWNTADEFRYAFKRLTGDGSIVARVDSIMNTNAWAKAGVMIRETLDAGSVHASVEVTPGNSCAFQRRPTTDAASTSDNWAGTPIQAPYWVKITRTGNVFHAETSPDGQMWTVQGTDQTIPMAGDVYIGLAVTSHAANVVCAAEFSEISTTGNVTGAWQQAEMGVDHPENSPQSLYVAVEDSAGKVATVTYPDPAATTITAWTEWAIPLRSFTGVNPAKVKKMYLGVGDRKNPVPDGAGRIYIDDIRITKGVPAQPGALP